MRGLHLTPVHQTALLALCCDLIFVAPLAIGFFTESDLVLGFAVIVGMSLPILILTTAASAVRVCVRSRMAALVCLAVAVMHVAILWAIMPDTNYFGEAFYIGLPAAAWVLASLAVATAGLIGWLSPHEWHPAASYPVCARCQYNLTGNVSGVCPECGTPIAGGKPQT